MGLITKILQTRSPVIHTLGPHQTVSEAIELMASQRVGAVLILEDHRLVGIFSERDLLRRVCAKGRDPAKTELGEVMTPEPVTASPAESRLVAMAKMQGAGCRHLPVVVEDTVIDMISMRDLLYGELKEREAEVDALRSYIRGDI